MGEAISPEEYAERARKAAERRGPRALSGFASPAYWTEERREAQRQWARQAHEEGRFGGPQPNSGPKRVKKAHEILAEKASDEADLMMRKLHAMLNHKDPRIQLQAIEVYLKTSTYVDKNQRDDEREVRKLAGRQLDDALQEVLADLGIVEATFEEMSEEEILLLGAGDEEEA